MKNVMINTNRNQTMKLIALEEFARLGKLTNEQMIANEFVQACVKF